MTFTKEVRIKDLYKAYLEVTNCVLNLTRREIEVMASILWLKYVMAKNAAKNDMPLFDIDSDLLGVSGRRWLQMKLGITAFNLNNYIKFLKDKGMLLMNSEHCLVVNPKFYFEPGKEAVIEFKLVIKNEPKTNIIDTAVLHRPNELGDMVAKSEGN